jgi:HSP20 family protein
LFDDPALDKRGRMIIFLCGGRNLDKGGISMAWEISPWRPFEFERMRRDMDRMWDSFFDERSRRKLEDRGEWLPSLDVSETKNEIVVKAEIPGIDPKDMDISLTDGVLTIKGEKKQEKEERDENYHLIERSYGTFARSVRLPKEVTNDKIGATYKNGLLTVTLPKSEETRKKEIKIKVE